MNKNIEELQQSINPKLKTRIDNFISIISDIGLGEEFILSGLLYFSLLDNKTTMEEIQQTFSLNTYNTVKILVKLDEINYSQQIEEAENLRKMFFAITKDIRTIMLKIALVVSESREIDSLNEEEKAKLVRSIFTLYAPLSARLGLTTYKTELEETAFKAEQPELQKSIQQEVDNRFHKRQPIVERLKKLVEQCMQELGIKGKIYGRKKHIYSIYKKLQDHTLDNIYDLIAVRAIVNSVAECYALLGRLHSIVEPMPNRFKDYIATPKPNGYQSLHTTVIFEGFPVEIQIRTVEMNKYAEYGVAAHWLYKEKRKKRDNLDASLGYLRLMMDSENISIDELASSLNQDIYNNDIFVQTPKGKVIYLPTGSTPIDFAYSIHSEVGNMCVGAKVNGKIVPTNSTLNNGDVVEIITNPNSKGPSRDWLKICKTRDAKNRINAFFKKNMREENIQLGKTLLENAIKDKGYSSSKLTAKKNLEEILPVYNLTDLDEFYASIGSNSIPVKNVVSKLASSYQKQVKIDNLNNEQTPNVNISAPDEKLVTIKGLNNILIRFANCCHPMPGDDIIGFVSAGRGIIIHRSICPNISFYDSNRLIDVSWKAENEKPKQKNKKTVKGL